eukprot:CAMPEP_0114990034 /NCGR_PEP_ID=MMETSP0216-20121206/10546_1 /TAXON_ID=223996 /ORGANISM="Protocruzia adherens, Strain Boccale" /LENGTH=476 /DNA_ID=CAMNT_0002353113 /DNA_START=20 /DNA_END=1450 /DNA_ORIENTATION=+
MNLLEERLQQAFTPLDYLVDRIGELTGVSERDQIQMIVCVLVAYPLGWIFYLIRNVTLRKLFGTGVGVFLQVYMFGSSIWLPFVSTTISYLLMTLLPRRKQVTFVFAYALGLNSVLHVYRMYTDYGGWNMDISLIQMILTLKMISSSFSYKDGSYEPKELLPDQARLAIRDTPSYFDYLGFMFFFSVCIVGPSTEYKDYEDTVYQRGAYTGCPLPILPSLFSLVYSFFCIGVMLTLMPRFPIEYLVTEEYAEHDFLYKVFYYTIAMIAWRYKYYVPWLMTQGAVQASGLGYNGYDKEKGHTFDKVVGCDPMGVELEINPRFMIECWNTAVQVWLKKYIYNRVAYQKLTKDGKPANTGPAAFLTFGVSAFWHGFYPCYYLSFVQFFFITESCKIIFRLSQRVSWMRLNAFTWLICFLVAHAATCTLGITFILLFATKIFKFYSAIHFWVAGGCVLFWMFLQFVSTVIVKKPKKTKTA